MSNRRHLRNAVAVPVGRLHAVVSGIRHHIPLQSPVSNTVTCHVHARHQAATRGRTDRTGVCLREHHALTGQPLHVGCVVHLVVACLLMPKRHRRILPSHIINDEDNDVGAAVFLLRTSGATPQEGCSSHGCEEFVGHE